MAKIESLLPEKIFLFLASFFGLLWILVIPPFQGPDEDAHFYRAFEISEGGIIAKKNDGKVGDYLPKYLSNTVNALKGSLPHHPEVKIKIDNIFDNFYCYNHRSAPTEKEFCSFPAVYSPVGYLPQVLSISVGKLFNVSPLVMMYLARTANLFFWITVIFWAIRKIHVGKWLILFVALMPMNLFLATTLNLDTSINSLSLLLIAIVLYLIFRKERIAKKWIIFIICISVSISLIKPVYFLFLLYFLIPKAKLYSPKNYYSIGFLIIILNLLAIFIWNALVKELFVPPLFEDFSPSDQLKFILHHPFNFLKTCVKSYWVFKPLLVRSHIGYLGWLDARLPDWLIASYVLALLLVSLRINDHYLTISNKMTLLGIIILGMIGVGISQYISCSRTGDITIWGLQGRYYIPMASLFWLLWQNKFTATRKILDKYFLLILNSYLFIVLSLSTYYIMNRYYVFS